MLGKQFVRKDGCQVSQLLLSYRHVSASHAESVENFPPSRYYGKLRATLLSLNSAQMPPSQGLDDTLRLGQQLIDACRAPALTRVSDDVLEVGRLLRVHAGYVLYEAAGTASVNAMERALDGAPAYTKDRSGLARKYRAGKHLPSDRTITKLEIKWGKPVFAEIYHPLFFALLPHSAIDINLKAELYKHWTDCEWLWWLHETTELDSWIFGSFNELSNMSHQASPTTLAYSLLMLHKFSYQKTPYWARCTARLVFHLCLVLAPELQRRGIGAAALALILRRLSAQAGLDTSATVGTCAAMAALLNALSHMDADLRVDWVQRCIVMSHLLRGSYGQVATLFEPTISKEVRSRACVRLSRAGELKASLAIRADIPKLFVGHLLTARPQVKGWISLIMSSGGATHAGVFDGLIGRGL